MSDQLGCIMTCFATDNIFSDGLHNYHYSISGNEVYYLAELPPRTNIIIWGKTYFNPYSVHISGQNLTHTFVILFCTIQPISAIHSILCMLLYTMYTSIPSILIYPMYTPVPIYTPLSHVPSSILCILLYTMYTILNILIYPMYPPQSQCVLIYYLLVCLSLKFCYQLWPHKFI